MRRPERIVADRVLLIRLRHRSDMRVQSRFVVGDLRRTVARTHRIGQSVSTARHAGNKPGRAFSAHQKIELSEPKINFAKTLGPIGSAIATRAVFENVLIGTGIAF